MKKQAAILKTYGDTLHGDDMNINDLNNDINWNISET